MDKNIKRDFFAAQFAIGGTEYRLHCKLKQKSLPAIGFPSIKAIVIFEKKKSGKWKKTKPVSKMTLNLIGEIYNEETCNNVFKTMNFMKSTTIKTKLKIRDGNVSSGYRSRKTLPNAINADFIWYYNNGQGVVGAFNEVLKP